jgi:hypothetical protein
MAKGKIRIEGRSSVVHWKSFLSPPNNNISNSNEPKAHKRLFLKQKIPGLSSELASDYEIKF